MLEKWKKYVVLFTVVTFNQSVALSFSPFALLLRCQILEVPKARSLQAHNLRTSHRHRLHSRLRLPLSRVQVSNRGLPVEPRAAVYANLGTGQSQSCSSFWLSTALFRFWSSVFDSPCGTISNTPEAPSCDDKLQFGTKGRGFYKMIEMFINAPKVVISSLNQVDILYRVRYSQTINPRKTHLFMQSLLTLQASIRVVPRNCNKGPGKTQHWGRATTTY